MSHSPYKGILPAKRVEMTRSLSGEVLPKTYRLQEELFNGDARTLSSLV